MLRVDLAGHVGPLALGAAFDTSRNPVVLTGPNGSGKTSLLLMILGALAPERGRVTLAETTLFDAETGVNVAVERRAIGYVPQHYGLFPHLTALQNVEFALACQIPAPARRERRERARALLAVARAFSAPHGEQQREREHDEHERESARGAEIGLERRVDREW